MTFALFSGAAGRAGLILALVLGSAAPAAAQTAADSNLRRSIAVLRWLDKVTGRVQTAEVPVNATAHIGPLEVIVRACIQHPPEEPPENGAFLDVTEIKPGQPPAEVFRGWMFSSSPALSAMEHPVYDLWVLDCKDPPGPAAPPSPASPAPPAKPTTSAPSGNPG